MRRATKRDTKLSTELDWFVKERMNYYTSGLRKEEICNEFYEIQDPERINLNMSNNQAINSRVKRQPKPRSKSPTSTSHNQIKTESEIRKRVQKSLNKQQTSIMRDFDSIFNPSTTDPEKISSDNMKLDTKIHSILEKAKNGGFTGQRYKTKAENSKNVNLKANQMVLKDFDEISKSMEKITSKEPFF